MDIKEGDVIRGILDGMEFTVKKTLKEWIVLESKDGNRQIMTGVCTLNDKSFHEKKEDIEG